MSYWKVYVKILCCGDCLKLEVFRYSDKSGYKMREHYLRPGAGNSRAKHIERILTICGNAHSHIFVVTPWTMSHTWYF
jgi:hypothetical protein